MPEFFCGIYRRRPVICLLSIIVIGLAGMTACSNRQPAATRAAAPVGIAGIYAASCSDSSFLIGEDGSLWAWGLNDFGQLGDGTETNRTTPQKVMDGVKLVAPGGVHTLILKEDGGLWAWGANGSGQLGDGTTQNSGSPLKIMDDVQSATAGNGWTMAIKNDGSLWAWGAINLAGWATAQPGTA